LKIQYTESIVKDRQVEQAMISFEQWMEWNKTYNCLPYVEAYDFPEGKLASWDGIWEKAGKAACVLESGKAGRYSFVAAEPVEWISGSLTEAALVHSQTGDAERLEGAPLSILRQWMSRFAAPRLESIPKFTGGIAGYLSYDVVRTIERLPVHAKADSPIPDYFFMRLEKLWIIDHAEQRVLCAVHHVRQSELPWNPAELRVHYETARAEAGRMKLQWDKWARQPEATSSLSALERLDINVEALRGLSLSLPKEQFMDAVEAIRHYIAQGDVFQVNLSIRQSKPLDTAPEAVYEALRRINPSPYMAFLRLPDGQRIVSGSPELLVRLEGTRLSTRPIAGTRPRGLNEGEDGLYQQELLLSEKERAEHIMLVDLERNDLGKISKFGTVRVNELMAVEHYSHVMHIVSEVEGELAPNRDTFDCIAAVFPGGTITGAPKIRTMEIIEELEPTRRGVYTGAIGWIDYNGNMELNITIRTLVYADGTAYVQSGAGIVIDSDPEKEFYESLNKAKALWKAVEQSEQISQAEQSGVEKGAFTYDLGDR
jgi:para-aminobenzoate synthetase component 1